MSSYRRVIEALLAALAVGLGTVATGLAGADPVDVTEAGPGPWIGQSWIDTSDRDQVVAAYNAEFALEAPDIAWTGDHDNCDAGTNSASSRAATIRRVNYYRAMAGVTAGVTEDPEYTGKAQRAAMMMSAEGILSHEPTDDYACFSADGEQAAANSNLYLGRTGPAAVDGYIEDPGESNVDVGHRNTILHPPTERMGVGDVAAGEGRGPANALWVFDDRVFDGTASAADAVTREADGFVAWPPRGYVPAPLVHPRWSFTMAGADLSQADVRMYRPGADSSWHEIPLVVVNRSGAPGHVPLPTVVWEPDITGEPTVDTDYVVTVSGVRPSGSSSVVTVTDSVAQGETISHSSTPTSTYTYTVRLIGTERGTGSTIEDVLTAFE